MAQYLVRRTIILVVSLLIAMIVIFLLLRALPGDPANALLSVSATPEQIAAARAGGCGPAAARAVRQLVPRHDHP
jgi:peptide/nickel transport system permease protein